MKPAELRRHGERGRYDVESVRSVFSDTFMAHVSYVDNGLPQCLPMIALFCSTGDNASVYLHGHPSSRLMEIVRQKESEKEARIGQSENKESDDPVRVCITATKVDGLVLSSAANGHTFNYRSAVVHGTCALVKDRDIKREVMRDVTNHIVAGRWDDVNPVASFQVSLVCVIRVDVAQGSLKLRTGIPGIQPRDRAKDGPDHDEPAWTGVVPLYEHLDTPVPSGLTDNAKIPPGLLGYIEERNEAQAKYAKSVAR